MLLHIHSHPYALNNDSFALGVILPSVLIGLLVGWVFYMCKHPHSSKELLNK